MRERKRRGVHIKSEGGGIKKKKNWVGDDLLPGEMKGGLSDVNRDAYTHKDEDAIEIRGFVVVCDDRELEKN